jgi:hypothetical protein
LCARSGEKTALAQSSPLYRSQGHVSRRGAQARIAWRNALRDAVDVTWKRNGDEYAWSFLRISRAFGISSAKRRCRGCIGCEQTAAKRDGRPKNASTGTGLSDVDISYDQSSRWQKFAAVPEEISSARCREKPTKPAVCRRLVTPISQSCSRKRTSAAPARMSALWPQADLTLKHLRRERPFHQTVVGRMECPQRNATTSSARPETGRRR